MKQSRLSVVLAFLGLTAISCKQRAFEQVSGLSTFSANSSGFLLEIEGKLDMRRPSDAELEALVERNLEALHIAHPDDESINTRWVKFRDAGSKVDQLSQEIENLHLEDPVYWIKEQLKFPARSSLDKILFSLDDYSVRYKRDSKDPGLVTYTGHVLIIATDNSVVNEIRKTGLYFPLRPIDLFFKTNPEEQRPKVDDKSKGFAYSCFKTDGSAIAPFNYFDYFNPYEFSTCRSKYSAQIFHLSQPKFVSLGDYNVWPEYQELFKDRKLTVAFAFARGTKPWGINNYNSLLKKLLAGGYNVTKKNGETDVELSKTLQPDDNAKAISIDVRIFYSDSEDDIGDVFANGLLAKTELVFFSGHSGYGANIFQLFGPEVLFPRNFYQIFFLLSCNSYSYGISNILASKTLNDLDLDSYYVDLITTAAPAYFHYFEPIMSHSLFFFEEAALAYDERQLHPFTYQKLIRDIDAIEKVKEQKAHYTVAGEERNRFAPGEDPSQITPPKIDQSRFDEFASLLINDDRFPVEAKFGFFTKLMAIDPSKYLDQLLENMNRLKTNSSTFRELSNVIRKVPIGKMSQVRIDKIKSLFDASSETESEDLGPSIALFHYEFPDLSNWFEDHIAKRTDKDRFEGVIKAWAETDLPSKLIEKTLIDDALSAREDDDRNDTIRILNEREVTSKELIDKVISQTDRCFESATSKMLVIAVKTKMMDFSKLENLIFQQGNNDGCLSILLGQMSMLSPKGFKPSTRLMQELAQALGRPNAQTSAFTGFLAKFGKGNPSIAFAIRAKIASKPDEAPELYKVLIQVDPSDLASKASIKNNIESSYFKIFPKILLAAQEGGNSVYWSEVAEALKETGRDVLPAVSYAIFSTTEVPQIVRNAYNDKFDRIFSRGEKIPKEDFPAGIVISGVFQSYNLDPIRRKRGEAFLNQLSNSTDRMVRFNVRKYLRELDFVKSGVIDIAYLYYDIND